MKLKKPTPDYRPDEVESALRKLRAILIKNPEAGKILKEYLEDSTRTWR